MHFYYVFTLAINLALGCILGGLDCKSIIYKFVTLFYFTSVEAIIVKSGSFILMTTKLKHCQITGLISCCSREGDSFTVFAAFSSIMFICLPVNVLL